MTAPDILYATDEHAGSHCPLCGQTIQTHQLIRLVGEAKTPTHSRCWENQGSASPPPGMPARAPALHDPAPMGKGEMGEDADGGAPVRLESSTAKIVLLLAAIVVSVIGPIVGIVVGSLWIGPESSPVKRRDGRELLIICSILFVLQTAMMALMLTGAFGALQSAAQMPLGLPF